MRASSNYRRLRQSVDMSRNVPAEPRSRRSYSRGFMSPGTFIATPKRNQPANVKRIAEYILDLSLLVFELQEYSSSIVAAS